MDVADFPWSFSSCVIQASLACYRLLGVCCHSNRGAINQDKSVSNLLVSISATVLLGLAVKNIRSRWTQAAAPAVLSGLILGMMAHFFLSLHQFTPATLDSVFVCILLAPVFLLWMCAKVTDKWTHVLCCVINGTSVITLASSVLSGSMNRYILINYWRRIYDPLFFRACFDYAFYVSLIVCSL